MVQPLATDYDSPLIVLTTDFSLSGAVGVMKGVILTINPRAAIIDLTHQIEMPPEYDAAYPVEVLEERVVEDTMVL